MTGFQSDQPDETQGYNNLEQTQKSANNIYGPSSDVMRFMANNCQAGSDELNQMSNAANSFLSSAITAPAVTTTTAKVQPGPRAMHDDVNYMSVNWFGMNQAAEDRSEQNNNNTNTGEEEGAIALRPNTMQNLSNNHNQTNANDSNILSGYGLQIPQGPVNDVYGIPNVNWVVRNQASEETNMNNTTNFPAHITAVTATTSTAKETSSNGDSPSSGGSKKRALEDAITPFESAVPIQSRAADQSLGHRTSIYRGVTRYILDYRTDYINPVTSLFFLIFFGVILGCELLD